MKSDAIDGSVVNGLRQPLMFSFVLDKHPGFKIFCEPDKIPYRKINKSVLITILFYLEDNDHKEVDFNGNTLTNAS